MCFKMMGGVFLKKDALGCGQLQVFEKQLKHLMNFTQDQVLLSMTEYCELVFCIFKGNSPLSFGEQHPLPCSREDLVLWIKLFSCEKGMRYHWDTRNFDFYPSPNPANP